MWREGGEVGWGGKKRCGSGGGERERIGDIKEEFYDR